MRNKTMDELPEDIIDNLTYKRMKSQFIKNIWKDGKVMTVLSGIILVVSNSGYVTDPAVQQIMAGVAGLLIASKDPNKQPAPGE